MLQILWHGIAVCIYEQSTTSKNVNLTDFAIFVITTVIAPQTSMRVLLLLLFIHISGISIGQISSAQQKALNSYVDYANQSAEEVAAVVKSIIAYYPTIHQKSSWG